MPSKKTPKVKPVKVWDGWACIDKYTDQLGGVYLSQADAEHFQGNDERIARVEILEKP